MTSYAHLFTYFGRTTTAVAHHNLPALTTLIAAPTTKVPWLLSASTVLMEVML
jgi:hypothetical protein